MKKNPKVSVIIPCYNLGEYIGETLESVFNQTFKDYEIIIVDDGSNDGKTPAILKGIKYPKVKVVTTENQGLPAARNNGIRAARGEYICPLDSDDMIAPTYLEKTTKILDANSRVGFVTTWCKTFEGSNYIWKTEKFDLEKALCANITTVASVYRKSCIDEIGGYDESLLAYEDWDISVAVGERGWIGEIIKEPLFLYRVRKGSLYKSQIKKDNRIAHLSAFIDKHYDEYKNHFKAVILHKEAWIADLQNEIAALKKPPFYRFVHLARNFVGKIGSSTFTIRRKSIKGALISMLLWLKPLVPSKMRPIIKKYFFSILSGKEQYLSVSVNIKKWSKNKPIISVVIPCYNYGQYIGEAIDSVLKSSISDYEIVIVNDGSTDQYTIDVLNKIHHPKIRIINQTNSGLVAARNNGIENVSGKYICCLDADDTIEPTYLEKAIELLESRKEMGFVYSYVQLFGDQNDIWKTETYSLPKLMQYNYVPVSAVFRKILWRQVGGYNQNMKYGYEDWDFWLSISEKGYRGYLIPEKLFNHRKHGKTMTNTAKDKYRYLVKQLQKNHPFLYSQNGCKQLRKRYFDSTALNYPLNLDRKIQFKLSEKTRVLYIGPWLNSGGAQQVLLDIVKGLNKDIDFTLMSLMEADNDWYDKFYEYTKNIYHIPNYITRWKYREAYILKFIKTHCPDKIVISGTEHIYNLLPKIKQIFPNIPLINQLHNDSPLGFINHTNKYKKYIDLHIGISKVISNRLINDLKIPRNRVVTISNTVDTTKFNPVKYSKVDAYKKFNLPNNKNIYLWLGRLSDEKDPLKFIKLAKLLSTDKSNYFVMAGDGPLKKRVLDRSRDLTNFAYLGQIEEVPLLLKISNVLVMTSKIEGMPMTALEALSMGVPVVTTDVGSMRKIIINDVTGYITNEITVEGKSLIKLALKLDRKKIRELSMYKFSNTKIIRRYLKIFNS